MDDAFTVESLLHFYGIRIGQDGHFRLDVVNQIGHPRIEII